MANDPPGRGLGGRDRNVEFVKTVKIPKRDLDPFFGERQQAEQLAKRHADLPRRPNVQRYEVESSDHGDHYAVEIRGIRGAGPRGIPDHVSGRGSEIGRRQRQNAPVFDDVFLGLGDPFPADIANELSAHLTHNELRKQARRYGVHLSSNAPKHRNVQEFIDQAPRAARELIGR